VRRMLIVLALAGAIFAGCGGDDDEPETAATPSPTAESTPADDGGSSPSGGGETVTVTSPDSGALEFDPTELTATAGEVTFDYSNPSGTPHAFAIDGVDGAVGETVQDGDAPPLTVELEPGEYEFFCPVGGHRAAGMVGTLTVE
jgi:plastocyanin